MANSYSAQDLSASELRIGNRVMYSGSDWVVAGINSPAPNKEERWNNKWVIELYQNGLVNATIDEIQPIPLTEAILLKCGFEKHINETQIDGIEMKLQISGHGRDGSWFSSCGKLNGGLVVLCLCRGNYFSNNFEYLHELQNIYYYLTNQELTINP